MANKRMLKDIQMMEENGFTIIKSEKRLDTVNVYLLGPKDTGYEGGIWELSVYFPPDYPFKSPSIGFINKIYHPNVDEKSGSICLDVLNKKWSPMYNLFNIFDTFIPQLLTYPNPDDPLNTDAAKLMLTDPESYADRVKYNVKKFSLTSDVLSKKKDVEIDSDDSE